MGGALAASLQRTDQIALGFFGDGGANTGRTWEAVNMAAVWKLPLIAFCENNLYAVETSIGRAAASGSIAERAAGFGLPAVQVDGQDVCAVYREVRAARKRAEAGDGPTFIEALTYRYHGHNTGEVTTYRTEDEVEQWRRSRDPVQRLRRALEEEGLLPEAARGQNPGRGGERVQDAIEFADSSPWPDTADSVRQRLRLGHRLGDQVMSAPMTVGQAFADGLREEMTPRRADLRAGHRSVPARWALRAGQGPRAGVR